MQASCLPTFPPLTGLTPNQDDKGIHVVDVRILKPDAQVLNDSDILISDVLGAGIRILCDGPVSSSSAQPTTCFLTVQLPWPLFDTRQDTLSTLGTFPLTLPGAVKAASSASGGEIDWQLATPATLAFLVSVLNRLQSAQQPIRLLARLTAKGNFIWDQDPTPNLYLDGEAFGIQRKDQDGSSHIGLLLPPSGNGKRGGDFEMWFWLVLPATLSGLSISPSNVAPGQDAVGTVTLSGAAPAGGAVIALAGAAIDASGAVLAGVNVATIPASVTIPAGQSSATFPVTKTTLPPATLALVISATFRITATLAGATQQANLLISRAVGIASLTLNPASILGASGAVTGTVTLNGPAPANGAVVALTSNNAIFKVPVSIAIPANQTSGTFQSTPGGLPINSGAVSVVVGATFAGTGAQATLTVLAPRLG